VATWAEFANAEPDLAAFAWERMRGRIVYQATLRLDGASRPRLVDGLVSGLHVPGESHFDLLAAFAPAERLRTAIELASAQGLSAHELGDGCLVGL